MVFDMEDQIFEQLIQKVLNLSMSELLNLGVFKIILCYCLIKRFYKNEIKPFTDKIFLNLKVIAKNYKLNEDNKNVYMESIDNKLTIIISSIKEKT